MNDNPSRAEAIFLSAAEIAAPQERAGFLEKECGDDLALRARVEALLASHGEAGDFLEATAPSPEIEAELARLKPEEAGERIGPYKLMEQIGQGGFGTVWVADQERPVRRRVALKIIKLGMDTKEVIARFEQERQALAMMDHPHIAKVLDAGATQWGRPFFVMELVRGIKITDYCDQANLPTAERLALFIQVCNAVQHAHQKGIIHRDLKPSNILVALHDGVPVPKVIDFGVAKATQQQRLTDLTIYTQFQQMIGTPLYMSPEQAEMSGLDIDTRSDIYSLGVLLYELLTGRTPFDPEELMKQGLDEIRRVIREEEPQTPSMFVRTMAANLCTNVAQHRQSDHAKLSSLLCGDLDWIVMKALEKDRTRRYETANGLALDIKRYLKTEPVHASPPSKLYRFRRLLKRNKAAFAAGTAVAAALIIGSGVSIWQGVRAHYEANRANAALDDLRATAPAFAEQARSLATRERFDEAIEKLDYAAKFHPDSAAQYLVEKADLLQCQFRFAEAGAAYRTALQRHPDNLHAVANAKLCEKLAEEVAKLGTLSRTGLQELYDAMQAERRPAAQLLPVARKLGEERNVLLASWLERLKLLPLSSGRPLHERLTMREDGSLALDLRSSGIKDLTALQGAPLSALNCMGCLISDLEPLREMPLKTLDIGGTLVTDLAPLARITPLEELVVRRCKISDLSPLSKLKLKNLDVSECNITEISALRSMPLNYLDLSYTGVTDLAPLEGLLLKDLKLDQIPATDFSALAKLPLLEVCSLQTTMVRDLGVLSGLPLKELLLYGSRDARNYDALTKITTLETLLLPTTFRNLPKADLMAIASLRDLPRLRQLAGRFMPGSGPGTLAPKEDFWREWDQEAAAFAPWRAAGIKYEFSRYTDGTWSVSVHHKSIRDISSLKGAPIQRLELDGTQVEDLQPLQGMRLIILNLNRTPVANLGPLAGMRSLKHLFLESTKVADLESLRSLQLEQLWAAETKVANISPLQGMPLSILDLRGTLVTDVQALKGMPLQSLFLQSSKVSDLEPLAGSSIENLALDRIPATDLTPLGKIATLKWLILPGREVDVSSLRNVDHLERLSYSYDGPAGGPSMTTTEFWADNDANEAVNLSVKGDYAGAVAALEKLIGSTSGTLGSDSKGALAAKGQLAKCHVWHGDFAKAVPFLKEIVASNRKLDQSQRDADHWSRLAATLAAAGHTQEYQVMCLDMARVFAGTKDKHVAHRVLKACSIAPQSWVEEKELRRFMLLAETMQDGDSKLPYFASAAMAEYRLAQWMPAEKWAEKVTEKGFATTAVANGLLAMLWQREGRTNDAHTILEEARVQIDAHWPPKKDSEGGAWHDWLIARLLFLEAEKLLATPAPAGQ